MDSFEYFFSVSLVLIFNTFHRTPKSLKFLTKLIIRFGIFLDASPKIFSKSIPFHLVINSSVKADISNPLNISDNILLIFSF